MFHWPMVTTQQRVLLVFPLLLLATAPIRVAKDALVSPLPPASPIVNSNGLLNTVFAGASFQLFLVLYAVTTTFKLTAWNRFTPILPTTTQSVSTPVWPILFKEIVKLAIIYASITALVVWAFGPSLFDRVNKWTGGYCDVVGQLYYRACVAAGGSYVNGFKSSGHSLIATTFGTAAINELIAMNEYCRTFIVHFSNSYKYLHKSVNFLVISVYIAWVLLFLITCLFYHSFLERIVGTSFALFIVYAVYYKM